MKKERKLWGDCFQDIGDLYGDLSQAEERSNEITWSKKTTKTTTAAFHTLLRTPSYPCHFDWRILL